MTHIVWHTGYNIVINLTKDDLGNPRLPNLWDEIYHPHPFKPGLLMCMESMAGVTSCPGGMYVQVRYGKRIAAHNNRNENHPGSPESDRHLALKEYVAEAAERHGFPVSMEEWTSGRRPDLLINGHERRIAWEIQISCNSSSNVIDRRRNAESNGFTNMWTVDNDKAAAIDRAPWSRIDRVTEHTIRAGTALNIRGGARKLHPGRCDGQTYEDLAGQQLPCPNRRRCDGWHPTFEPIHGLYLDAMTGQVAAGDLVPLWVKTGRGGHFFWVTPIDRQNYLQDKPEERPAKQIEPDDHNADRKEKEDDPTCRYGEDSGYRSAPAPARDTGASVAVSNWTPPAPVLPERPAIPIPTPGVCLYNCDAPARPYACGWRCEAHRPNSKRTG